MLYKALAGMMLALSFMVVLPGCGGGTSNVDLPPTAEIDPVKNLRSNVKAYADSGQMDSGMEVLKEELDAIPDDKLPNKAEVSAAVEELMKGGSSASVKKSAEKVLSLLPE